MTVTLFDPFKELSVLQHRLNRVFGEAPVHGVDRAADWVPPVDIYETAGHDLVIKAELPDVVREEIAVTVDRDTLTFKGVRTPPADVPEGQFRRVERRYGAFSRTFTLPSTVDASKVTADYKHGVLTLTLPYKEEAKPRTISVDVAA